MNSIHTIILGIFQGLTEFLPVSSSAHLVILGHFLENKKLPIFLNIAFHLGTALAVLALYYRIWLDEIRVVMVSKNLFQSKLLNKIVIANIPVGIVGILCEKYVESLHRIDFVVYPLIFWGIALWLADKNFIKTKTIDDLSLKDSFLIGCFQIVALIPGSSRSGMTILAARILKLKTEEAIRFSFLISTPIMFGATLLHTKDYLAHRTSLDMYLGILTSFLIGIAAIKLFIGISSRLGFLPFAIYRTILGLFLLFYI